MVRALLYTVYMKLWIKLNTIALAALTACGQAPSPVIVDVAFIDGLNAFKTEGLARGIDLSDSKVTIIFKEDLNVGGNNKDGIAIRQLGQYPVIEISPTFWTKASEDSRQAILFHELGHALLSRPHVEQKCSGTSLMSPIVESYLFIGNNKKLFLDEMFHKELFNCKEIKE